MATITSRIAALSPKQREMLELRLKTSGIKVSKRQIIPRRERGVFPVSFMQQRLWFLDQLTPGNPAYNNALVVRLKGRLHIAAFEESLRTMVTRHEMLRTHFTMRDGQPLQVVSPSTPLDLRIIELDHLPQNEREREARRLASEESQQPFDLSRGPLIRTTLLRLAAEDHIMLLTVHHIISDAWSMNILISELSTLYGSLVAGEHVSLPPLPIQYADYAEWQRELLSGDELERQLTYWREQLEGAPALLELSTDHPRPPVQSFRGAHSCFAISQSLSQQLNALSRREGVTLFVTMLTAFKVLLYRYTGQTDVVVGTPIANRNRLEVEGLIGLFLNTLALRTKISGEMSFLELLKCVQKSMLGAYAHQELPFERIVSDLQPERSLSHSPVFQVMFTLQNSPPSKKISVAELQLEAVDVGEPTAKFDLTLAMEEVGSTIAGSLEYNCDLFEQSTIVRMANNFKTLLESIVGNPEQAVLALPILAQEERRELLQLAQPHPRDYQPYRCLQEWFEEQVEWTPEATALIYEDQQLSYAELNRRANQLAHYLRRCGVGPEQFVGLLLERSVEMVVAILGVLKAGGAYVPLDPEYPQQRLSFMMADAAMPILLTQSHLLAALPEEQPAIVIVLDEKDLSSERIDNPAPVTTEQNLAYCIYTSGSTGQPKGAMNTHAGICNRLRWMQATYQLTAEDRVLQKTTFSFDVSVWEFFWPLISGAGLAVARPGGHRDSSYLVRVIREQKITTIHFVPSMLRVFLEEEEVATCKSLKRVICSGEALPFDLQQRFFARLPEVELHNLYGPTEAAVDVTAWACNPADNSGIVPIGKAITNTEIYILDRQMNPAPLGVAGELHIGGIQLARGYVNRPELTADRFVPHPFSREGERLYRTGDLAMYQADGNVRYLGRLDHQVKIRGHRIELGEIEAALVTMAQVQDVVVLARDGGAGEQRLVAYVVAAPGAQPTINELREWLKQKLPEYMVPAGFVFMEKLPLTTNGKLNRAALPALEHSRPRMEEAYVAPRTKVEETLAQIWQQVLGLERVGVEDNFFTLGGDSILSIQIVARANRAGIRLTPRQMFQHQTISGLASVAGSSESAQAEQGIVTGPVPLTPVQHWFFERELLDPHHFNQTVMLESRRPLDSKLLERVVEHLLVHHDALRLRFVRTVKGWEQNNSRPSEELPFARIDLSAVSDDALRSAIETEAASRQSSLNLSSGPLLQIVHFDLGPERPSRLLIVLHHLLVDGVSWRILLEDLRLAYESLERGNAIELAPKTTSYKQWSERLHKYVASGAVQSELSIWAGERRKRVARLTLDHPEGVNSNDSERSVFLEFGRDETQALIGKCLAPYRLTINDLLLTALAQAFARWTGEDSVLIDMEGHGREDILDDVDLSRTIGWFTTIYPVLLTPGAGASARDDLRTIKEQLRQLPNHGIGYGLLRYLSQDQEQIARLRDLPRAEIIFNYLGQLDQILPQSSPFLMARESSGPGQSSRGTRSHVLDIGARVIGGQLQLSFSYSSNQFERQTIENLSGLFSQTLRSLIAHCLSTEAGGYTPSDFPLAKINQEKLDWLVGDARDVEDIYPLSPTQQAMLSFALAAPDSEAGFEQMSCSLHGEIDAVAFERACQHVVDRHPILRTSFYWEQLQEPLQVVRRHVKLPFEFQDWRNIPPGKRDEQIKSFLDHDRLRGFDFTQSPVMRAALIRLTEDTHLVVWSHHHVLMDGWGVAGVVNEVFAAYEVFKQGGELKPEPSTSYRGYIEWLQQQDVAKAESFWRRVLKGFTKPTPLPKDIGPSARFGSKERYEERHLKVSAAVTSELHALARQHQITLNTIVQGSWALLLAHYSQENDIVFGVTVSGRPAELPGIESMLGLFINILPMRIRVAPEESFISWVKQIQEQQLDWRDYEYSSLIDVKEWSEVPAKSRLFESLLVFQNYPATERTGEAGDGGRQLSVGNVRSDIRTNYPLTLVASPNKELDLLITFDTRRFEGITIDGVLAHFTALLENFAANPVQHLADLPRVTEQPSRQQEPAIALMPRAESIPPRNAIELRIAQIWEDLLGVRPIGVTDNFFDLGGHSLLAIRLMGQIRDAFEEELPLAALLQGGTVADLARMIGQHVTHASMNSAIALQPHGSEPPLFMVHPSGGHVMCYLPLARRMYPEHPVYGLRALDYEEIFDADLESMAARQIAAMREIQPEGPYHLAGWSFGALLAYEMAQQLQRQGEQIGLLAVLDITAPVTNAGEVFERYRDKEKNRVDIDSDDPIMLARLIGELAGQPFLICEDDLRGRDHDDQLRYILDESKRAGIIPQEMGLVEAFRILRGYRCRQRAASDYVAEVFPGQLTVFFSNEQSAEEIALRKELYGDDPSHGWSRFSSHRPDVHVLEGSHRTIINEPQVEVLAGKLKALMATSEFSFQHFSSTHLDTVSTVTR